MPLRHDGTTSSYQPDDIINSNTTNTDNNKKNNTKDQHETAITVSEESYDDGGPTTTSSSSSSSINQDEESASSHRQVWHDKMDRTRQKRSCIRLFTIVLFLTIAFFISLAMYLKTEPDAASSSDISPLQSPSKGDDVSNDSSSNTTTTSSSAVQEEELKEQARGGWWIEYYYNIGGDGIGPLWKSDESILVWEEDVDHHNNTETTSTKLSLCDDVTYIFCTVRQSPVLLFRFDPQHYPGATFIHLYFVQPNGTDNTSPSFTVYVDGIRERQEWIQNSQEESTYVVTVPMGRELQVQADGRPPLLAGLVLSNRLVQGPIPWNMIRNPPTSSSSSPPYESNTTNTTVNLAQTYIPGDLLPHPTGLTLSRGLTARVLAIANQPVVYENGNVSDVPFHTLPDAGATFPTSDGGWIYVSNSEVKPHTIHATTGTIIKGGVGALRFNAEGNIQNYQLVLTNTTMNCGGGRTPWGAWISGEELNKTGRIWQVDPTGIRPAQPIPMGDVHSGFFESFAYDVRDRSNPHFFMTQDEWRGALRRFTPTNPNWNDPWSILLGNGTIDYLTYQPIGPNNGTFQWTQDFEAGAATAFNHFPNSEGIDVIGGQLFFVTKRWKSMHILDLDKGTYQNVTTRSGLFGGQPDQIERIFEVQDQTNQVVYFTEDGDERAGIHARTAWDGKVVTILESSNYSDETTGLSFSPNGKFMYFAYQDEGVLFEVKREDGLPFQAKVVDVRYHDK